MRVHDALDVDWGSVEHLTLKPSSGGLEQLVTNLSSCFFCLSVNPSTACQKYCITWWSAEYPPERKCDTKDQSSLTPTFDGRDLVRDEQNVCVKIVSVSLCSSFNFQQQMLIDS